jgi:hypothetical protein
MSATNGTVNSIKGTSTLVRARFGPGMLLHHDDLEQLNAYTRDLSRLMFRSLFGCGVVCGLVVKPPETKCGKLVVTVGAGLALDCDGDPVYLPKDQSLAIDEECDPNLTSPLWVILCGNTKCCAPRTSTCASDDDESPSVCTRERDGFEIRIVSKPPKCTCGGLEQQGTVQPKNGAPQLAKDFGTPGLEDRCKCADPTLPCYVDHYDGKCGCCRDEGSGSDCNCDCILLARLMMVVDGTGRRWAVDHSVRCFVRPVLMRDPQVEIEQKAVTKAVDEQNKAFMEQNKAAEDRKKAEEDLIKAEQERKSAAEDRLKTEEQAKNVAMALREVVKPPKKSSKATAKSRQR